MMIVRLKKKGEKSVLRFHPWVFSGAVERTEGNPAPGDLVQVLDSRGGFLAWGAYGKSGIRVRLLDWNPDAVIDDAWWRNRIADAVLRRNPGADRPGPDACRLVFSESDGVPGLIVDRFGPFAVLQALTPAVDRIKVLLAETLMQVAGIRGVVERSDADARSLEGLKASRGLLAGDMPPPPLEIEENGYRFQVDLLSGQKTGFFLDQCENRRIVAGYAAGGDVLDCFSHTAAFSVQTFGAGARSVVRVESSAEAAALGDENLRLNGFDRLPGETVMGDAFRVLREFRDQDRGFDLVILDPPKLAPTRAQVDRAARAYKDINLLAFKLLKPGGVLATFSCSGGVDQDLFQKIVFSARLDAGREAQIVRRLHQPPDHPVLLSFPESEYLKGLVCRTV